MTEPTNQDIKPLLLKMDKRMLQMEKSIDTQFTNMEKSIDQRFNAIDIQFAELKGEIKCVETKIDGVQAKLDTRLDGLEKRLSNEEIISRSVVGALFISVTTGLVKLLFSQILCNLGTCGKRDRHKPLTRGFKLCPSLPGS